jgi:low molecular weight protein-tyrosine phosphatase
MATPRRILFVCLGNLVRSPLAEHLFRQRAADQGLDGKYEADSAGTSRFHVGQQPDERMRRTAARHGLEYSGTARHVTLEDLSSHDLILAMDEENLDYLHYLADRAEIKAEIRLMRPFDPQSDGAQDVPDPYYGGSSNFENTYAIISRAVDGLLGALEHGGP